MPVAIKIRDYKAAAPFNVVVMVGFVNGLEGDSVHAECFIRCTGCRRQCNGSDSKRNGWPSTATCTQRSRLACSHLGLSLTPYRTAEVVSSAVVSGDIGGSTNEGRELRARLARRQALSTLASHNSPHRLVPRLLRMRSGDSAD